MLYSIIIHREESVEIKFHSFHSKILFTVEIENNKSKPFLDVMLIRSLDNVIIFDWYQKPTLTQKYINFSSQHSYFPKNEQNTKLKKESIYIKLSYLENLEKKIENKDIHRINETGTIKPYVSKLPVT